MNDSTVLTNFLDMSTNTGFHVACAFALAALFLYVLERRHRSRLAASVFCSFALLLLGANESYAGFFDDMANKAARAAKHAAGNVLRGAHSTADSGTPPGAVGQETAQAGGGPPVPKQAQSHAGRPSSTGNLDFPWDHIDIDMRTEQVDAVLTKSGLARDSRNVDHGSRHFNHTYRGKWLGKWPAVVQVKARKGVISYLRFNMDYPRSHASRIADYFAKILPKHYAGTGSCGRDGDRVTCMPLKDAALSARRGARYYHNISTGPDRKTGKTTKVYYELSMDTHGYGHY